MCVHIGGGLISTLTLYTALFTTYFTYTILRTISIILLHERMNGSHLLVHLQALDEVAVWEVPWRGPEERKTWAAVAFSVQSSLSSSNSSANTHCILVSR